LTKTDEKEHLTLVDIDLDFSGKLPVSLANTRHHDGHGGVTDDLASAGGAAKWVAEQLDFTAVGRGLFKDAQVTARLTEIRDAVRSLFAEAVSPHPPSPGEFSRRMPPSKAFALLSAAAEELCLVPIWEWDGGRVHATRRTTTVRVDLVVGVIAVRTLDFLQGELVSDLRSCHAPHCVKYFVRSHGRQEWCKASCASRARAARFAGRHRLSKL
jgi:predicted RNA-binding Zn ribbon-like protein